jgi:hypothetical protein
MRPSDLFKSPRHRSNASHKKMELVKSANPLISLVGVRDSNHKPSDYSVCQKFFPLIPSPPSGG